MMGEKGTTQQLQCVYLYSFRRLLSAETPLPSNLLTCISWTLSILGAVHMDHLRHSTYVIDLQPQPLPTLTGEERGLPSALSCKVLQGGTYLCPTAAGALMAAWTRVQVKALTCSLSTSGTASCYSLRKA